MEWRGVPLTVSEVKQPRGQIVAPRRILSSTVLLRDDLGGAVFRLRLSTTAVRQNLAASMVGHFAPGTDLFRRPPASDAHVLSPVELADIHARGLDCHLRRL